MLCYVRVTVLDTFIVGGFVGKVETFEGDEATLIMYKVVDPGITISTTDA